MGWDVVVCGGVGWNGTGSDGMGWDGVGWDGAGWNEMERGGMRLGFSTISQASTAFFLLHVGRTWLITAFDYVLGLGYGPLIPETLVRRLTVIFLSLS